MSIRVAIVGAGAIGANHAAAIVRHPRLRVVALADPARAAGENLARWVAERTGAEPPGRYDTLAEALHARPVELVAVCTPTGLHAAVAEQALAAGTHVVIEKPLDVSLRRARSLAGLAAAAQARGQLTSVVSQRRFDPAIVAVARAVAAGGFGRLTSAVASVPWWRSQRYYDSAQWRGTWALDGGGALMNQGVHVVDLLLWLLGRPEEVFAHIGRLGHHGIEVEDVAVATMRFASGALAVLHATTAAYPGLALRLQLHGTRGSAVIQDGLLEYLHTSDGGDPDAAANQAAAVVPAEALAGAPKPADGFVAGHLRQYRDIVEAIDGQRPPGVGVDDGLLALAVVEAVYLSATLSRPIAVDDVLGGCYDGVPLVAHGGDGGVSGGAGVRR